jgi:small subunit ribosomal protein S21
MEWEELFMSSVELRPGESPESLLRRFRKTVMKNGILKDARKKRHFVSKSEQRRIAKRKAIRRMRRRERQSQYRQNRY